jgi:hypothetical protein
MDSRQLLKSNIVLRMERIYGHKPLMSAVHKITRLIQRRIDMTKVAGTSSVTPPGGGDSKDFQNMSTPDLIKKLMDPKTSQEDKQQLMNELQKRMQSSESSNSQDGNQVGGDDGGDDVQNLLKKLMSGQQLTPEEMDKLAKSLGMTPDQLNQMMPQGQGQGSSDQGDIR